MKSTFFTLLALSLILFSCQTENIFETDLLTNNDLETGSTTPTGWFSVPGPYQVEWSETEGYKSDRSITISSDSIASSFGFYAQEIPEFEAGKFLELKLQMKLENVVGEGIAIAIRGDDAQVNNSSEWFTTTQQDQVIDGDHDWKEYTLASNSRVPDDIEGLTIYLIFLPNTTGKAYFDDVSLDYVN